MVRLSVPPIEQVLFGEGRLGVLDIWVGGERGFRPGWVGRMSKTVLGAFMNVFGAGPVPEIFQNYFRRQQM